MSFHLDIILKLITDDGKYFIFELLFLFCKYCEKENYFVSYNEKDTKNPLKILYIMIILKGFSFDKTFVRIELVKYAL